jgi:glycosyltransferase involved in cell wall biosynthesis
MSELVSVIIPTFNSGSFLKEAVESAINQDYSNIEIVVVDDGSTDGSIEELISNGFAINLIQTSNYGAASARNAGIFASKGSYIAFLDSDDVWKTDKISKQIDLMQRDNLDLAYCHGQEFKGENEKGKIHYAKYSGDCYKYYLKYPTRDILAIGPSGTIIRRSIFSRSGIFDSRIPAPTEDWDFFRRCSLTAKIGFCDEILVFRRIHANNISRKSLLNYYNGNRSAVIKMLLDDRSLGLMTKRITWAKFNYISAKGFFKNKEIKMGFLCILKVALPILL